MVTSRDVARLAGVSQATVSRAMLPDSNVKPATLRRIQQAMDELGYMPNAAAQAMRTGRTNTVGVVVADITNPYYPELVEELTHSFDLAGKRVIIWNSDDKHNQTALEALSQGIIDGLVFTTIVESSPALIRAIDSGHPIVMVNRHLPQVECDQVRSANAQGAALVADHFLDHGRTRIACITGPRNISTAQEREDGFIRRLAERGYVLEPQYLIRGAFSHESGFQSLRALLDSTNPPDAVFCVNDLVAYGALDYARSIGLQIPESMWIVGYDDIQMSSWQSFQLTTVRQRTREMASEAARLLLRRINDPNRPIEDVCFDSELILRNTAGSANN